MNTFALSCRSRAAHLLGALALLFSGMTVSQGQVVTNTLVQQGEVWSYLDDGSDQGAAWRAPEFDDSGWPMGFAQFGYGDFDEETTIDDGPSGNHFLTYYFRRSFELTGVLSYTNLTLSVLRDDGVAVYLNGTNIWRNNLPAGALNSHTLALTNVFGEAEDSFYTVNLPPFALRNGLNFLAVEVHQSARTSSDLSFDLRLTGLSVPPRITRGPYLQNGGTTNIIVRWRSSIPTDSRVWFGGEPDSLDAVVSDVALTTEHEMRLTGLLPDTLYYYSVGTTERRLAGDASCRFVTAPSGAKPTRVWVIGDSGTANANARAVYDAYRNYAGARHTDLWLMLGDNAYGSGRDDEYQRAVFNMYPELLRQTVLWSTIGNHETYSVPVGARFPYFDIFSLPENAEAGGLASGTERYYSFDYGNIHFVCLDAMTSLRTPAGPMATWLEQDLAANTNEWLIAFWHHPPYTKGSHDSDFEGELVEMRHNIVPILEAHGVDLVLSGHSHCYERSFLINGHYGESPSFSAAMKVDGGSGRENAPGPYLKPSNGPGANLGAVYVVAGSSGQATFGALNHPAMFFSELQLGSLVLDIDGPTLQAKFLRENGAIDDHFTIFKGAANPLRIVSHRIENGMLVLQWNARRTKSYIIQAAASLTVPDWTDISTTVPGTHGTLTWAVPLDANPPRVFFRLRSFDD